MKGARPTTEKFSALVVLAFFPLSVILQSNCVVLRDLKGNRIEKSASIIDTVILSKMRLPSVGDCAFPVGSVYLEQSVQIGSVVAISLNVKNSFISSQ